MSPAPARCAAHDLTEPCRACRADALVAGPDPEPTPLDGPSLAAGERED